MLINIFVIIAAVQTDWTAMDPAIMATSARPRVDPSWSRMEQNGLQSTLFPSSSRTNLGTISLLIFKIYMVNLIKYSLGRVYKVAKKIGFSKKHVSNLQRNRLCVYSLEELLQPN